MLLSILIILTACASSTVSSHRRNGRERSSDSSSLRERLSSSDLHRGSYKHKTPKNIILFVADGFGINYNAAYRLWKALDTTIFDKYLVGEYSVFAVNQTVPDSASTATALASGVLPKNGYVGTDLMINPVATILEAAKKQGKGVGAITTSRITHATPASFTAKSFSRGWENLIAKQQGQRIIGDVDILFGGGKRHFIPQSDPGSARNDDFDIMSNFKDYGWNSLIETKSELLSLNKGDIPCIGLFMSSHFRSYMVRKNNIDPESAEVPGLLEMTKKALELLAAKYKKEGFFIMIEAAQIDWGGHDNDLAYLVNEVDEYAITVDYVINDFIQKRRNDDTLVVMVSDHEAGGLSLGRASHWKSDAVQQGPDSNLETIDLSTNKGQSIYSFDFDPLISHPPIQSDGTSLDLSATSMYQFFVEPLDYPTMPAWDLSFVIQELGVTDNDYHLIFEAVESFYIEKLTEEEKSFIISCYNRNSFISECLGKILSVRSNAGWTTHGHTGNDVRISAFGPGSDRFKGWNGNIENIGNKLIDIFNVREEIKIINKDLKQLFVNEIFEVCDPTQTLTSYGYNIGDSISWPKGNYRFPGFCVEEFM